MKKQILLTIFLILLAGCCGPSSIKPEEPNVNQIYYNSGNQIPNESFRECIRKYIRQHGNNKSKVVYIRPLVLNQKYRVFQIGMTDSCIFEDPKHFSGWFNLNGKKVFVLTGYEEFSKDSIAGNTSYPDIVLYGSEYIVMNLSTGKATHGAENLPPIEDLVDLSYPVAIEKK